jgi:hypothetical protein
MLTTSLSFSNVPRPIHTHGCGDSLNSPKRALRSDGHDTLQRGQIEWNIKYVHLEYHRSLRRAATTHPLHRKRGLSSGC